MTLFIKHVLRSFARAPLQPLLIILTVALSTASCLTAIGFGSVFYERQLANENQLTAAGDILITVDRDSDVRMLFEEDVKEIIGDKAKVLGEYSVSLFAKLNGKKRLISACATDIDAADDYFSFKFVEYDRFTSLNLNSSAIISEKTAEKFSLSLGDELPVSLLGEDTVYTVRAIAKTEGIFLERDVVVSIEGVRDLLAKRIPLISMLGAGFLPCTRIMIKENSLVSSSLLLAELKGSEKLSGYMIEDTFNRKSQDFFLIIENVATALLSGIVLTLSVVLILSSLSLLHEKRRSEYALFSLAGAPLSTVSRLIFFESTAYAVIGGVIGAFFSDPMLKYASELFGYTAETSFSTPQLLILGLTVSVALMSGSTLIHLKRYKECTVFDLMDKTRPLSEKKSSPRPLIVLVILTLLLSIAIIPMPATLRYIPAFPAAFCTVFILYLVCPFIIKLASSLADKAMSHCKRPPTSLWMCFKSLKNNFRMRHIGRMMSVLLGFILLLSVCFFNLSAERDRLKNAISAEIISVGSSDTLLSQLEKDSRVLGIAKMKSIVNATLENSYTAVTIVASGDIDECLGRDIIPNVRPVGESIVLSRGVASLLNKRIGDTVHTTIGGGEYDFTVSGIEDINANIVYIDASIVESSYEITLVKLSEGSDGLNTDREDITALIESDGAYMISSDDVLGTMPDTLSGFLDLSVSALILGIVISVFGCLNLLLEAMRQRTRERDILALSGASRRRIFLCYAAESVILFLISLLIAALFFIPLVHLIDVAILSFGYVLI